MANHLRYSGLDLECQKQVLADILRADTLVWPALVLARELDLPDWMVVSGAIYNTVWNVLTGKPSGHGVRDVDLFYHDDTDLGWDAENAVIQRAAVQFAGLSHPVEVRNQARVHLWYPEHFGRECPAYRSSEHSLGFFASRTHSVGVRLALDNSLAITAPFGLDDMFSMRMIPNRQLDNARTHSEKGARAKASWPEVKVVAW